MRTGIGTQLDHRMEGRDWASSPATRLVTLGKPLKGASKLLFFLNFRISVAPPVLLALLELWNL
jgi:hypothetical protein